MSYDNSLRRETLPTFLDTVGLPIDDNPYITHYGLILPGIKTSVHELLALYIVAKNFRSWIDRPLPKPKQLERIQINPVSGCWELPSSQDYGRMSVQGINESSKLAHRVMYNIMFGNDALPEELSLDHLCENKKCCWHRHTEPVTQADNMRRIHHAKRLKNGQVPLF